MNVNINARKECLHKTDLWFHPVGRKLNIEVVIVLEPPIIAVYENAIKVTADGPREPRSKHCLYLASYMCHLDL